ncbi:S-layer homology domain-containing protein [Paenibacillus athensensis]|uniref:SLH domain-containing protein n=1 Tax=Paenibacillus athensensis TaxID=1967502 RepID=A0A4Y8Q247_9BACL|nr:S-layer homology domain-containing protein [Paenibacillus athensensis]MCD1261367.1 S-layer homology domain-containing protein [Paenibacillus athensensis]
MKAVSICKLVIIVFLLSWVAHTSNAAAEFTFRDVSAKHWAYPTITWAIFNGIANGFEDGTFRPDEAVTEEQFISLLVRAFGDIPDSVSATAWSDKYYTYLSNKNYPLAHARNTAATRTFMAEIISSTQSVHYSGKFAIQYLLNLGLVNGKTSATIQGFRGNDYLTRAEALQCIKNVLEKVDNKTLGDRPLDPSDTTALNVPLLPVEKLKTIGNAEQVILVTAADYKQVAVKVETFEKVDGVWYEKFPAMDGTIGEDGFTSAMSETVKKSPEGVFTLTEAFGKYENPGTQLPYRQTDANDYWVDDPQSSLYNTWQEGPSKGRWKSAEPLLRKDSLYDYAVVINYNTSRTPGKGSAIFLHVGQGKGTAGCTAISKSDLVQVMKWLAPQKHPVIVQAVESSLAKL